MEVDAVWRGRLILVFENSRPLRVGGTFQQVGHRVAPAVNCGGVARVVPHRVHHVARYREEFARAAHPNATLADLYDPLTMPPDLVKAHAHLDALVDKAYGLSPSATDTERVAHLFKLYAKKVKH